MSFLATNRSGYGNTKEVLSDAKNKVGRSQGENAPFVPNVLQRPWGPTFRKKGDVWAGGQESARQA